MNHANVVDDVLDNVAVDLVNLHALVSWASLVDNALFSRVKLDRIYSALFADAKVELSSLVPPKQPVHLLQFLWVVLLIEAPRHHHKIRGFQMWSLGVFQIGMGVLTRFSETLYSVRIIDLANKRGHVLGEVWGTAATGKHLINDVTQLVDLLVCELVFQVGNDVVQLRCANSSVVVTFHRTEGLNELLLGIRIMNIHAVTIVVNQREGLFRFGNPPLPALQVLTPVKLRHRLRRVKAKRAESRRPQHEGRSTSETARPGTRAGALRT
mmetsp:Transcript_14107/g.38786  ORF Transcript_14107/g.38786 Transcript_14107/m.38786 type:complete len:268 (-) Transcript_14107:235-1038(-)